MKFSYKSISLVIVFIAALLALIVNGDEKANALSGTPVHNEQSKRTDLSKLKKQIDREIGKPRASRANQCRIIAFGAKACGGPKSYLIYSTLKTNEDKLKRLVAQYNSLEEKINKETNAVSDCMFIQEPEVTLVNGMCKIK